MPAPIWPRGQFLVEKKFACLTNCFVGKSVTRPVKLPQAATELNNGLDSRLGRLNFSPKKDARSVRGSGLGQKLMMNTKNTTLFECKNSFHLKYYAAYPIKDEICALPSRWPSKYFCEHKTSIGIVSETPLERWLCIFPNIELRHNNSRLPTEPIAAPAIAGLTLISISRTPRETLQNYYNDDDCRAFGFAHFLTFEWYELGALCRRLFFIIVRGPHVVRDQSPTAFGFPFMIPVH